MIQSMSLSEFARLNHVRLGDTIIIREDRAYDTTRTLRGGVVAVITPIKPLNKNIAKLSHSIVRYGVRNCATRGVDACIEITKKNETVGYMTFPDDAFGATQADSFKAFQRQQAIQAYVASTT